MSDYRDPMDALRAKNEALEQRVAELEAQKPSSPKPKKPRTGRRTAPEEPAFRIHGPPGAAPQTTSQALKLVAISGAVVAVFCLGLPFVAILRAGSELSGVRMILGIALTLVGGGVLAMSLPRAIDPTISWEKTDAVGTRTDVVQPRAVYAKACLGGFVGWAIGIALLVI